jgi:hypothetical protein
MTKRNIPNFVCIGAPRAGTTWLYRKLKYHKDVYVPESKKELNYFNENYGKGLDWYKKYFRRSGKFSSVGEISPSYLYSPLSAYRMSKVKKIKKILIILRDPIERTLSHYKYLIKRNNIKRSFSHFVNEYPKAIEQSLYYNNILSYLNHFNRKNIKILIFEEVFEEVDKALREVEKFLEIDSEKFPDTDKNEKINNSNIPRFGRVYSTMISLNEFLLKIGLEGASKIAKNSGIKKIFEGKSKNKNISIESSIKKDMAEFYKEDVRKIEKNLRSGVQKKWLLV